MSRKILITKSYGAGWSSGASNTKLAKFMLEYEPIIEFLEAGNKFVDKDVDRFNGKITDMHKLHYVLKQFASECFYTFGEIPYLGGATSLTIAEVDWPVLITDNDGREGYEEAVGYL